ncbi:MAG: transposase [Candidatus Paceibacteria bacterium]
MGHRREPIVQGEWYHCYTRGIDGRATYNDQFDYQRFTQALYLSNSAKTIERSSFWKLAHNDVFSLPRDEPLVAIGAYALMPNHFHLLLKEQVEGGISQFMQRLGTSYTKYFNERHDRIGSLFVRPFRSRHVGTDSYLRRIVSYIHCNPAEIFEPGWKDGRVTNVRKLKEKLEEFPHASLFDYVGKTRPERNLLDNAIIKDLLNEQMPPLQELLPEMIEYYKTLSY